MTGIKVVALLIGTVSVAEANSLANGQIEQKLAQILARNEMLVQKQTLLKSLEEVDQELINMQSAEGAAAVVDDGSKDDGDGAADVKDTPAKAGAEQPASAEATGAIDDKVTVEAGVQVVEAAKVEAATNEDTVIKEESAEIKENTKVLDADTNAAQVTPEGEGKTLADDLVQKDTAVVESENAIVVQVNNEKKAIEAALETEKVNVQAEDKPALEASKSVLDKVAGQDAVEEDGMKVAEAEAKAARAKVADTQAELVLKNAQEAKAPAAEIQADTKADAAVEVVLADANKDVEKMKKFEAADQKEVGGGNTGLIAGLVVALVAGLGVGYYCYNKKSNGDEEGGDDLYTKFIDQELSN